MSWSLLQFTVSFLLGEKVNKEKRNVYPREKTGLGVYNIRNTLSSETESWALLCGLRCKGKSATFQEGICCDTLRMNPFAIFFFFGIGIELIYSVVLISGV